MIQNPNHPRSDSKGYVLEHIIVMESILGRPLIPPEEVHHINGNSQDNRPENLQLFPNHSEHIKHHIRIRPKRFCSLCGALHFGKGFCVRHYNEWRDRTLYNRINCEICGTLIRNREYMASDGKKLCRKCRFPKKLCKLCKHASAKSLGFCCSCYQKTQEHRWTIPCSKCGKPIRKTGRNQLPAVCWNCRFPKRTCRLCGGKHEAFGLCENHYKQWKRGTLLSNSVM